MDKDLHFTNPLAYNHLVTILFAGYVLAQIPSGLVLSKCRPAAFLSVAVFLWGTVSMCCGFAKNWGTMMGLRLMVGVFEAPFFVRDGTNQISAY